VGNSEKMVFQSGFFNPHFAAHDILLDRLQTSEVALRGFDMEVGAPLPYLERFDARAFVGFYHYDTEGVQVANGVGVRLEAQLTSNIPAHFSIANDAIYNTTVNGGLAIHFGGPKKHHDGPRPLVERLGDRVVRDVDIAVTQKTEVNTEKAIDPATGQP